MIIVHEVVHQVTGFMPISFTNPEEAQKWIAAALKPAEWRVRTTTIWDTVDERDYAIGIGQYAPQAIAARDAEQTRIHKALRYLGVHIPAETK